MCVRAVALVPWLTIAASEVTRAIQESMRLGVPEVELVVQQMESAFDIAMPKVCCCECLSWLSRSPRTIVVTCYVCVWQDAFEYEVASLRDGNAGANGRRTANAQQGVDSGAATGAGAGAGAGSGAGSGSGSGSGPVSVPAAGSAAVDDDSDDEWEVRRPSVACLL